MNDKKTPKAQPAKRTAIVAEFQLLHGAAMIHFSGKSEVNTIMPQEHTPVEETPGKQ